MSRNRRLNIFIFCLGVCCSVAVTGCYSRMASAVKLKPYSRGQTLAPQETIIVGVVELKPPLKKEEQKSRSVIRVRDYVNKVLLTFHTKPMGIEYKPGDSMFKYKDEKFHNHESELGQPFYLRWQGSKGYFLQGLITLSDLGHELVLPGSGKINLRPEDKAVYIGRLRYHRNEYNEITRLQVVDDFGKERKIFAKNFSRKYKLVKRLAKSVRYPED